MTSLEQECRTYTRYLSGQDATSYIIEKYIQFHTKREARLELDKFDVFLVHFSARSRAAAALADSYTRIFRKESAVRKKLILVCALLECAPPSFEALDSVPPGGFSGAVLRLAAASVRFVLVSLAAIAILGPVRAVLGSREI